MARNPKRKAIRRTVALVGDGQTERIYFSGVRDTDRPTNLSIFPDYPRKIGSYKGVIERALALKKDGYDRVYALIDMDKIIDERKMSEYRMAKAMAEKKEIVILENNPCFEIWILLHFVTSGRLFSNCDNVITAIRKVPQLVDYNKTERYLSSANLYSRFKQQLIDRAIPNSRILEQERQDQSDRYPRAEIFRFFEWYLDR